METGVSQSDFFNGPISGHHSSFYIKECANGGDLSDERIIHKGTVIPKPSGGSCSEL